MKRIVMMIVLAGVFYMSHAQESPVKDQQLKTLIEQAVTNYPRIKELEEQVKFQDVKGEMIKSNYQPTVSGEAMYNYAAPSPLIEFEMPTGKQEFRFQPYNNYAATVTVRQLVYDFGKTKFQLSRNESEKGLATDNLDTSKNAIAYQVSLVYYLLQFLQQAITVQQQQVQVLKDNENLIQAKIKNGDALQYDLLTTQTRTSSAVNRLNDLKSQLQKQYVLLNWLTGQEQNDKIKMVNTEDNWTLLTDTSSWKSTNADAKILNRQMELLEHDYKAAAVNTRPSIMGSASGGMRNGIFPDINEMRGVVNAGVGISIPIVSASRPKIQRKMAEVQMAANRNSLETVAVNVRKDLATIHEDFINLQQKTEQTNILVQQAEKAFKLAQVRFKEGLITNVELLTLQASLEDAKLQQVQLQYQMQVNKIESHKVIGTKIY